MRTAVPLWGYPKLFFPSTGYFGLTYVLQNFDPSQWKIMLCGFSWEGWRRHPWGTEREWVMSKVEQNILSVIKRKRGRQSRTQLPDFMFPTIFAANLEAVGLGRQLFSLAT